MPAALAAYRSDPGYSAFTSCSRSSRSGTIMGPRIMTPGRAGPKITSPTRPSTREAAAMRAYDEWMPVGGARWRIQVGDLATIFLPETRITARDKQFEIGDILADKGDAPPRSSRYPETGYRDPARRLRWAASRKNGCSTASRHRRDRARAGRSPSGRCHGRPVHPRPDRKTGSANLPDYVQRRGGDRSACRQGRAAQPWTVGTSYPAARDRLLAAAQRSAISSPCRRQSQCGPST